MIRRDSQRSPSPTATPRETSRRRRSGLRCGPPRPGCFGFSASHRIAKQIYRTGYQDVSTVPDDVIADYLTPILGNPECVRFITALLCSMTPEQLAPIHPLLAACDVPTAIIWGTGDIFFRRPWADWLVDLIPGATHVTEIPGGRLFFPDDRGPELVAALEAHWAQHR